MAPEECVRSLRPDSDTRPLCCGSAGPVGPSDPWASCLPCVAFLVLGSVRPFELVVAGRSFSVVVAAVAAVVGPRDGVGAAWQARCRGRRLDPDIVDTFAVDWQTRRLLVSVTGIQPVVVAAVVA